MNTTPNMTANILLGDLHGNFGELLHTLHRGVLDNTRIFQVGDFGIGFTPHRDTIKNLNKMLAKHSTHMYAIRGNHDDPSYWLDPDKRLKFNMAHSHISLLPDYFSTKIGGKSVLFIGGAISVNRLKAQRNDRERRVEEFKPKRYTWWPDEGVAQPPEDLAEHDVIIAHNTTSFFNKNSDANNSYIQKWIDTDKSLKHDLDTERSLLDDVFHKVKPKEFFSGHHHNGVQTKKYGCSYKCIDIAEFFTLTNKS